MKWFKAKDSDRLSSPGVPVSWHNIDVEKVFRRLQCQASGLTSKMVEKRRQQYGFNKLAQAKSRSVLRRFFEQFHNVLIYVLLVAGIVTAVLGHKLDSTVIFAVVLINAIFGFVQEGKAEQSLKAISKMLSLRAMVLRDGEKFVVKTECLVPGDTVFLQTGDKVPADLRLIQVKGLHIQEAALTGESVAIEKSTDPVDNSAVLGDRRCMAYSGTLVASGYASGIVVATGENTEIGHISSLVAEVGTLTTPLLRQMSQFGARLTLAILSLALFTFIFGVLVRDHSATDMFLASVSLAVAAIPEGLPAIMTIILAIGVQRMARKKAIIRRLPAVETLGSVSVICSDKTGTLTKNEMTVRSIVTSTDIIQLSGTGYDPHGALVQREGAGELEDEQLISGLRASVLCNDSSIRQHGDAWCIQGDPMEGAILVAGMKAGLNIDHERQEYHCIDMIPFRSEHRFMATLHHDHTGKAYVFVKGAPEHILAMCNYQGDHKDKQAVCEQWWLSQVESLAAKGQRVLAVAMKQVDGGQAELSYDDVINGLTLLLVFGLIDPPREDAILAVRACIDAGVRVKMITGDHAMTARAIAKQLELINLDSVLTGQQLENIDDDELQCLAYDVDIYARVNPEHKLRLVKLLQAQGLIVAMTGDGVNDAPALKRADVGTAMGKNGTEVAKEASEMVLADDNFSSIADAVKEGRTVYDNLRKAILFILPTNGAQAMIIVAAIFLGFELLPLTPVQILWVNMVTAVTLAISLAFEPPEAGVMRRPPRQKKDALLTPHLMWRIILVSLVATGGTFSLYLWEMRQAVSIEYCRTVAVNTLVMFEIFYLFNSRYFTASVFNWSGLTGNRYVLAAIAVLIVFQLLFTYSPFMQHLFATQALGLIVWVKITIVASSVLFLVEIEKYLCRRLQLALGYYTRDPSKCDFPTAK